MKKLPRIVYVRWEEDDEEPYLLAGEELEGTAADGYKTGVYELRDALLTKTVIKKKRSGTRTWFE